MPEDAENLSAVPLSSYVIASADMRYIEVNTREIYLREEAESGLSLRGEIPGCGKDCYANLSQMLLEYALTCEGCKEEDAAQSSVAEFGARLGKVLAARLSPQRGGVTAEKGVSSAFDCLVHSLGVPFEVQRSAGSLQYTLESCPLCETGSKTGLKREMRLARQGFAVLCESLLASLSPEWKMLRPLAGEPEETLDQIILRRVPAA